MWSIIISNQENTGMIMVMIGWMKIKEHDDYERVKGEEKEDKWILNSEFGTFFLFS